MSNSLDLDDLCPLHTVFGVCECWVSFEDQLVVLDVPVGLEDVWSFVLGPKRHGVYWYHRSLSASCREMFLLSLYIFAVMWILKGLTQRRS